MGRRPYKRPLSRTGWWLAQPRYIRYMLRELSSLFIGTYTLVLIVGLYRLSQGKEAWDAFMLAFTGGGGLLLALLTLIFSIYHSYTWFQVTPKAMPLEFSGKRLPGNLIIGAHWAVFAAASAALWMLIGVW